MSLDATKHYESTADFFRAFLDPYLKYGCGYFNHVGENYADAARNMLDRTLMLSETRSGHRILDVGFGWGSFLQRLVEKIPDCSYLGLNPSPEQLAWVDQQLQPNRDLRLETFETFSNEQKFDRIFFNDSICHIEDKAQALKKCASLLDTDGVVVIQDTFFLSEALRSAAEGNAKTKFVQQDVFGFARLICLSEFVAHAEQQGFSVQFIENVSAHYERTILSWLGKLHALDARKFPVRDETIRYLEIGLVGLEAYTGHFLIVLRKRARLGYEVRRKRQLIEHRTRSENDHKEH